MSKSPHLTIDDVLLPGLPRDLIVACYSAAPGKEIASGKFLSPESSSCLVANVFGPFFANSSSFPPLPSLDRCGLVRSVTPEVIVRFPWRGGRHPCLDVLADTSDALIGIESKRYEPFRSKQEPDLSEAYARDVWGDRMKSYCDVLEALRRGPPPFAHLDAAQLVKHAFALRTAVQKRKFKSKRPVLYYLYAEPKRFPGGRTITAKEHAMHRTEIGRFTSWVTGDEVAFHACSYREMLASWSESVNPQVQAHASAVLERFDI